MESEEEPCVICVSCACDGLVLCSVQNTEEDAFETLTHKETDLLFNERRLWKYGGRATILVSQGCSVTVWQDILFPVSTKLRKRGGYLNFVHPYRSKNFKSFGLN